MSFTLSVCVMAKLCGDSVKKVDVRDRRTAEMDAVDHCRLRRNLFPFCWSPRFATRSTRFSDRISGAPSVAPKFGQSDWV